MSRENGEILTLPVVRTTPGANGKRGVKAEGQRDELVWNDDDHAATNYAALGGELASSGEIYRSAVYGNGLILLLADGGQVSVTKGADLLPVIVDRLRVRVLKDGKIKGSTIAAAHLNAMLKSETFLGTFPAVDYVTKVPVYLPDFKLASPGYNDGGPGHRVLYTGGNPAISDSLDTINEFLDVMDFDAPADRTNAVAAALTVMLRNHWPGGKPIIVTTATKSHAGKDTVIAFASGVSGSVSISYQATNWALERSLVGALKTNPDTGVVVIENARLDRRDKSIASAIIERFATDPEPMLFSTGTGGPLRRRNDIVLAISTNYGSVSEDIMNRGLPIHLSPVGNVADRQSPIGNPKHEFLPAHRDQIAAELLGMIERWKAEGMPLDKEVAHPFTPWARTIGGILKVNGFDGFLANYGVRRTLDDPVRSGLAILGAHQPDRWLPPADWARLAADLGLVKTTIPAADRDSDKGRKRGMGVVLSAHRDETLVWVGDNGRLTLRLEKKRARWDGSEPHVRYRFAKVAEEELPVEEETLTALEAENEMTVVHGAVELDIRADEDDEKKYQLYRTPQHITGAVLQLEPIDGSILEPCVGKGDLANELFGLPNVTVYCSDIYDWGFAETEIRDFFSITKHYDCIMTNPPHKRAGDFVRHAKTLADKVIVLLPLGIEHNVGWSDLRTEHDYPIKAVHAFTQAIPWVGWTGNRWYTLKYGWFVFEKGYTGPTVRKSITFNDGEMVVE